MWGKCTTAVNQHEYTLSHLSKHVAVVAVQPVSCSDYNDLVLSGHRPVAPLPRPAARLRQTGLGKWCRPLMQHPDHAGLQKNTTKTATSTALGLENIQSSDTDINACVH